MAQKVCFFVHLQHVPCQKWFRAHIQHLSNFLNFLVVRAAYLKITLLGLKWTKIPSEMKNFVCHAKYVPFLVKSYPPDPKVLFFIFQSLNHIFSPKKFQSTIGKVLLFSWKQTYFASFDQFCHFWWNICLFNVQKMYFLGRLPSQ